MQILYISNLSSERLIGELHHRSGMNPGFAVQKFSRLLVKGLMANGSNIKALTNPPIMSNNSSKFFEFQGTEQENGVTYYYAPIINLPFLKQIFSFIYIFFYVLFWGIGNRKDKAIICDVLIVSSSVSALLASKLNGIKSVGVVTDIPGKGVGKTKGIVKVMGQVGSLFQQKAITSFDKYVLLTEQMNALVNPKGKPYIVMEALCDSQIGTYFSIKPEKTNPRTMLYAGGLHEKYGLKMLVEAFLQSEVEGKLVLYGDGPYVTKLKAVCSTTDKIEYRGVVSNEEVVAAELKASILVNPRFTNESFSAYSFPSKNMEYMASGTPLLTTNLPGMPAEYRDYVYLFDEETVDGYAKAINYVFSLSSDILIKKGSEAQRFVLDYKNNVEQGRRVLNFLVVR